MFSQDLLTAANTALDVLDHTSNVNGCGWIQRASRAVRQLTRQWGGKAPDEFQAIWNQIVQAEGKTCRVELVKAANEWLAKYFGLGGDQPEMTDNQPAAAEIISGIRLDESSNEGNHQGEDLHGLGTHGIGVGGGNVSDAGADYEPLSPGRQSAAGDDGSEGVIPDSQSTAAAAIDWEDIPAAD